MKSVCYKIHFLGHLFMMKVDRYHIPESSYIEQMRNTARCCLVFKMAQKVNFVTKSYIFHNSGTI